MITITYNCNSWQYWWLKRGNLNNVKSRWDFCDDVQKNLFQVTNIWKDLLICRLWSFIIKVFTFTTKKTGRTINVYNFKSGDLYNILSRSLSIIWFWFIIRVFICIYMSLRKMIFNHKIQSLLLRLIKNFLLPPF